MEKLQAINTLRVRTAQTDEEFQQILDWYTANRYRVMYEGKDAVLFKQRTWGGFFGHFMMFVLMGWWTLGLANLIMAIMSRTNAGEVIVRKAGFSPDFEVAWRKSQNKGSDVSTSEA